MTGPTTTHAANTAQPIALSADAVPLAGTYVSPRSLRQNFSWTLTGNIVYAMCQWGMLVALARVGTPETLGVFTFAVALTGPVFLFTNLGIRNAQVTDTAGRSPFRTYLAVRVVMTAAGLCAVGIMVLVLGYQGETLYAILAVGVAKGVEAVSDVYYGLFQQHERLDYMARSMMIKGPIALGIFSLGVWLTGRPSVGAAALAVVWLVMLSIMDIPLARSLLQDPSDAHRPLWKASRVKRLIWLTFPLGLVMLLGSLNANLSRYFIQQSLGLAAVGVFAAMAYVVAAAGQLTAALGHSAVPRLARYAASRDASAFLRLLWKLIGVAAAVGIGGVLVAVFFGQEVLVIVYGQEYATQNDVFVLIMAAGALSYVASFLGYSLTGLRYFRVQLPVTATATAVNATLCAFLIPSHGLAGAAVAMAASYLMQSLLVGVILVRAISSFRRRR